jgi:predicted PurR-regulated permease PerM
MSDLLTPPTWQRSFLMKWFLVLAVLVGLIYLLKPMLPPFLVGAILAYLGNPLVMRLQTYGVYRTWAVVLVFCLLSSLAILMLVITLPLLIQQIEMMIGRIPDILEWIQQVALPFIQKRTGINLSRLDFKSLKTVAPTGAWGSIGNVAGQLFMQVTNSSLVVLGVLGNLAMIPVVTFYLLKDWHVMLASLHKLVPRAIEPTITQLAHDCNEVLAAFLRGQLLVMCALGMVYSLGLWLIGIPFAFLIGILAGLASIVPYLGFILGIIAALITAAVEFKDWLHPGLVIVVFVIGQMLEGSLLTPMLVGDRIGLHPVAVIFAVLAGAQLFGFVGMLLALPVAAVILVILRQAYHWYLRSEMYEGGMTETNHQRDSLD